MIEFRSGNLLEAVTEALVNTVNTVGVMGKGIALQFKKAFPENYEAYERVCKAGELLPGGIFVFDSGKLYDDNPHFILNLATKDHWRAKSRISDVVSGMNELVRVVQAHDIHSIAIPPLGCGNGGLKWEEVRPLIERAVAPLEQVQVLIYVPQGAPRPEDQIVRTKRPKMTRGRALILNLMACYQIPGYKLGMLEIQKLGYFLQCAGEDLRLKYRADKFGPYAENVNHVLQRLDGHFIQGYGDRSSQAEIELKEGAIEEAQHVIAQLPMVQSRLKKVSRLIDGFETPHGMELLATVLWVAREYNDAALDTEAAVRRVHFWSDRKRDMFKPQHISVAWKRLQDEGWFNGVTAEPSLL